MTMSLLLLSLLVPPLQDPAPSAQAAEDSARPAPTAALHWPAWRGPLGTGEAPEADPPLTWSEDEGVVWKTHLGGHGHSTPVVVGDRLILTTATPFGPRFEPAPETDPGAHDNTPVTQAWRFEVVCVSATDGAILWRRVVREETPHERVHYTGSFAAASPVTDGTHVWAFFGSRGLYCLDLDGWVLWEQQLGKMRTKHHHGEGSSPALFGDALVVNWDHEEQSFVTCLDKETGEERWRAERDEVTSWATPIVAVVDGKPQAIVPGTQRVRGYDLGTGEVVWECPGLSHNVVASPVFADGILVTGSSYEKQAMLGLRLAGAVGDLSTTKNLLWYRRRITPYVPSPCLADGWLYFLHHNQGFLARVAAASGEQPESPVRLEGLDLIFASPLAAAGRVYVVDRSGTCLVLSQGAETKILATNRLDDGFNASPVAVGRRLYLRGERFLYCVEQAPKDPSSAQGETNPDR